MGSGMQNGCFERRVEAVGRSKVSLENLHHDVSLAIIEEERAMGVGILTL